MQSLTILLFLGNIRGTQLLIVALVILLLFGGKKIPELMRGLGRGVHSFKQGINEARREMERPLDAEDADGDAASSSREMSSKGQKEKPE